MFLGRELKHEVGGEALLVALHGFVEVFGFHTVESGQIVNSGRGRSLGCLKSLVILRTDPAARPSQQSRISFGPAQRMGILLFILILLPYCCYDPA